ncbi:MAG: hypothetical protein ACK42C_09620, partial [Aquificaceae bacterium]
MRKLALVMVMYSPALAFFPFEAEDAGTLGGLGNFQFETNYASFKYYNGARRQSLDFQFQAGLLKNMDLALLQQTVAAFGAGFWPADGPLLPCPPLLQDP